MRLPLDARRTGRSCGSTGRSRRWTGLRARRRWSARRRFQELLTPGGRIYHETHYAPLLRMQGTVREIAVEIVRADGTRLPALVNSVMRRDDDGRPPASARWCFDATDRRRYEEELLRARRREHEIALHLQRSLLAGRAARATGASRSASPTGPPSAASRSAATGTTRSGSTTATRSALVVGDVVGRGIDAAATMGQLRSAVRALASTGLGPGGGCSTRSTRTPRRHAVGRPRRPLVYAQLDLGRAHVRYACAGHPPPVLVQPGAGAALPVGRSLAPARRGPRRAVARRGGV